MAEIATVGVKLTDEHQRQIIELCERYKAENDRLREESKRLWERQAHWELGHCPGCPNVSDPQAALERVSELEELLPESGRYYRAETVEAYVAEIARLRELVADLWPRASLTMAEANREGWVERMRENGVEVEA